MDGLQTYIFHSKGELLSGRESESVEWWLWHSVRCVYTHDKNTSLRLGERRNDLGKLAPHTAIESAFVLDTQPLVETRADVPNMLGGYGPFGSEYHREAEY